MTSDSDMVLAIGANSFFARRWAESDFGRSRVRFVHHHDIGNPAVLRDVRTVVSFVRPADYDTRELPADEDANALIARWLAPTDCRLVMLSSRQVYGDADSPFREDAEPRPRSVGARNRLQTERRVAESLADRLTILRCANLFGFEMVPGRSRFMAVMLRSLLEKGRIELSVSGSTRRDFLPDEAVVEALSRVAAKPAPGVFNLGSGVGTALSDLAAAAIAGFGSGEVAELSDRVSDAFVLDMTKWNATWGPLASGQDVLDRVHALGVELRRHRA